MGHMAEESIHAEDVEMYTRAWGVQHMKHSVRIVKRWTKKPSYCISSPGKARDLDEEERAAKGFNAKTIARNSIAMKDWIRSVQREGSQP